MTVQDTLNALQQPFDAKYMRTNNDGSSYWPASIFRFYLRRRAPGYSMDTSTSISSCGTYFVCDVSITIPCDDGTITRSENGFCAIPKDKKTGEHLLHKVYGDPASNASSQAVKKCCRLFGMGRIPKD